MKPSCSKEIKRLEACNERYRKSIVDTRLRVSGNEAFVFVDSQAALARTQKPTLNHIGQQLRAAATRLPETNWKVTLQWVPSHKGIFGNETADKAAKQGLGSHQNDGVEAANISPVVRGSHDPNNTMLFAN